MSEGRVVLSCFNSITVTVFWNILRWWLWKDQSILMMWLFQKIVHATCWRLYSVGHIQQIIKCLRASLSVIFIGVVCYMCGCCGPGGMFNDPGERLVRRMRDEFEEEDNEKLPDVKKGGALNLKANFLVCAYLCATFQYFRDNHEEKVSRGP